ncbi:MAG: DUF3108 domain-containing protein [Hyphomicrobiaceae bacterium]
MFERTKIVVFGAGILLAGQPAAAQENWPKRVSAVYRVGVPIVGSIGKFEFSSRIPGNIYEIEGRGELKWSIVGLNWKGTLRSSGIVAGNTFKPELHSFESETSSTKSKLKMSFDANGVKPWPEREESPAPTPHNDLVPLKEEHLKNVFDPATAAMVLNRAMADNRCGQSIAVLDGIQRFDLKLEFRREMSIPAVPGLQPAGGFVCGVRYVPIAGHRDNAETKKMAEQTGYEVAFAPIPDAKLAVPYRISVPLPIGSITMTLERIEIERR